MNKRENMLNLIEPGGAPEWTPAAFFLHFDPAFHQGKAAVDKHLEFFQSTGMDFVKIQFESTLPPGELIQNPKDWTKVPVLGEEAFAAQAFIAEGLAKAAKKDALVVMTLYSPLMWAARLAGKDTLARHFRENPEVVKQGLEILTQDVIALVKACKRAGIDGFYVSTQGGETNRFKGELFLNYIKPTDLAVWDAIGGTTFNILHVCDYEGPYDDLSPYLDYPGHVVNCSLKLGEHHITPKEVSQMFARPFMGGMDRLGTIAGGSLDEIQKEARSVLQQAPARFILAADCTVPSDTSWKNLHTAITTAHQYKK